MAIFRFEASFGIVIPDGSYEIVRERTAADPKDNTEQSEYDTARKGYLEIR